MTLEELDKGKSLCREIIDAENELRELNEWSETIEEQDEKVWISSKTKSICVLNWKKVLPLIQERIKEVKEILQEKRTDFEKL